MITLCNPIGGIAQLFVVVLIARAIFSWFPLSTGSPLIPVVRFLHAVTEPLLAPVRRIIPPAGMFDMSFLVVLLLFEFVIVPLACRVGAGL